MPGIDARVDDGHADAAAGEAAQPCVAPCQTWSAPIASAVTVAIAWTRKSPETLATSASSAEVAKLSAGDFEHGGVLSRFLTRAP